MFKSLSTIVQMMKRHEFVKNVAFVSSGVIAAQSISVLSSPIISRLFTPDNFGIFAIFISLVNVFSLVTSLAYENAIILPVKKQDAINLAVLSFIIHLIVTGIITIAVLTFSDSIAELAGSVTSRFWVWMIPPMVFLKGLLKIINNWATREKKFKAMAISTFINSSITVTVKIVYGFLIGAFTAGLIGSSIIGILFGMLYLSAIIFRHSDKKRLIDISYASLMIVARRYKKFPLYSSWNVLLNAASKDIIIYLFSFYFTPAVVGLYYFSMNVLKQPLNLISDSVGKVYYQKVASQYSKNENLYSGLKRTTQGLFFSGIIPFGIITLYGKEIFDFVFGNEWAIAGEYAQILSPWLLLLFINRPSMMIYRTFQKLDILLIYVVLLLIARIISISLGYYIYNDPKMSMIFFSFVGVVFNCYFIYQAFYWVNIKTQN